MKLRKIIIAIVIIIILLSVYINIIYKETQNITANVLPTTKVIPVGNIAGIKLYTSGVLVVGMSEIQGKDNKKYKPYENCGIEEGDTLISINDSNIENTDDLIKKVNDSKGENVKIKYLHNSDSEECSIKPIQTENNEFKLGLWVRDSAAGVGTVSFYEPQAGTFAALGHGLTDIDTGKLIDISSGEFVTTKILNVVKGKKGEPGKIQGTIQNGQDIGRIYKNSKFGIFGTVDNLNSINIDSSKEMEVATRDEIKLGKATIMCCLENNNVEEYEVEIERIYKFNNYDNKSMLVRVTDKKLLEKTGGIIQRNEWLPINAKWKIYWCNNLCFSKFSRRGLCCFC